MPSVNNVEVIRNKILHLKQLQQQQLADVKVAANNVTESVKPINIIKSAVQAVTIEPNVKQGLLDTAIGLATGLITKKAVVGNSTNIFKKLLGDGIQFLVSNFIINKLPNAQKTNKSID